MYMQIFADFENDLNTTETLHLDLMDITPIMNKETFMLR